MKNATIVCAALLVMSVAPAFAAAPNATVSDAWIRALPASVPSGGYFTLHNNGDKPLTLTGASSPACGMLMLHKSEDMGGMMHMDDMTTIDVPAKGTLKFSPGGYHLMCMDATSAIKPGNTVDVTLQFAGGAALTAKFIVKNAAGH